MRLLNGQQTGGETGTGKEVLSNVIVRNSSRAKKPFIKVNCAAIPQELMEYELFGYEEDGMRIAWVTL